MSAGKIPTISALRLISRMSRFEGLVDQIADELAEDSTVARSDHGLTALGGTPHGDVLYSLEERLAARLSWRVD